MGRYINPDEPFDDETKEFLRGRARNDEVIENERRFPPDGDAAAHEEAGFMPTKVGYDYETQANKVEDALGVPLDRIPTDDEGRPMVKEYGYVEGIIHESEFDSEIDDDKISEESNSPAASESESTEDAPADDAGDDEDGDLDDDILERVMALSVEELKDELEKLGEKKSGNKDELIDRLANRLQDDRDKANES